MLPTSPTFQREQTSSMQPLETYIQWELKSDGLPRAQVKPDMFRRFYIVAGLDTVKECWVQILREGDRMDRFLHAMEMIPWVTTSRQFFLHRIRGLLYGWLIQYPGDRRTKWEITPICYTGPVMLKIKDNRLDKDGMWQTGSLGTWIVNKEGHGITGFNEDPAGTITFDIKDILKEPDDSSVLQLKVEGGVGGQAGKKGQAGRREVKQGGERSSREERCQAGKGGQVGGEVNRQPGEGGQLGKSDQAGWPRKIWTGDGMPKSLSARPGEAEGSSSSPVITVHVGDNMVTSMVRLPDRQLGP
ncbi:hypothetical protein LTR47_010002 [Exophiala xenobiotica]|nr:hypothetical protein LTR47_010002 [Exophiala xenobiotica]KAK5373080.1 hypothetical protein LTR11_005819 [Exophiala xenobiotica]KAK5376492.1 hypothetical protein LTS03_005260 [Exophiala xenobiotica]